MVDRRTGGDRIGEERRRGEGTVVSEEKWKGGENEGNEGYQGKGGKGRGLD